MRAEIKKMSHRYKLSIWISRSWCSFDPFMLGAPTPSKNDDYSQWNLSVVSCPPTIQREETTVFLGEKLQGIVVNLIQ